MASDYVLVTPVRDEEATIGRTIDAVLRQTILPREWVIVSDGSTDGTDDILRRAAKQDSWIRLLFMPPRPGRSWRAVVINTEAGIRHLNFREYRFLGLLDADVTFQPDYFEQLLARFEANPALGLAGGVVLDAPRSKSLLPRNRRDVGGPVQFFRKECFDRIGGLIPIPEGGWDAVTCAMARMQGFETQVFTELVVENHKPRKPSVRWAWIMGFADYAIGYHPLFETVKCVVRYRDPPAIIGSLVWWIAFCAASIRGRERVVPPSVIAHIQQEQLQRLRPFSDHQASPVKR
jgi:biofilm PGA synthesis N-glycosyltransferase PgaC